MGILHKLVFILGKLDPHNEKWRQRQVAKAEEIEDVQAREIAVLAINNDFANNAMDYLRSHLTSLPFSADCENNCARWSPVSTG
jgi:hypothetical protein